MKTDGHLWLHFQRIPDEDQDEGLTQFPAAVSLAGVETKFIPLVYFKGTAEERKKQEAINNEIAAFIAKQLKGKTVWIEDARPGVFAGPWQYLGIVWFDRERTKSLQQLLVKNGLAVEKKIERNGS